MHVQRPRRHPVAYRVGRGRARRVGLGVAAFARGLRDRRMGRLSRPRPDAMTVRQVRHRHLHLHLHTEIRPLSALLSPRAGVVPGRAVPSAGADLARPGPVASRHPRVTGAVVSPPRRVPPPSPGTVARRRPVVAPPPWTEPRHRVGATPRPRRPGGRVVGQAVQRHEVRTARVPATTVVLRRALAPAAAADEPGGPVRACGGAPGGAPAATGAFVGPFAGPLAGSAPRPAVLDLDAVTGEVLQRIERRAVAQRERRGRGSF